MGYVPQARRSGWEGGLSTGKTEFQDPNSTPSPAPGGGSWDPTRVDRGRGPPWSPKNGGTTAPLPAGHTR